MPKRKKRKGTPPSSYETMAHYFPTEQVDIVGKVKSKGRMRRRRVFTVSLDIRIQ